MTDPRRILVHQTLATSPFTLPVTLEWQVPGIPIDLRRTLTAEQIGADEFALAPAVEIARLGATHSIVPEIAICADAVGAIAMQTPVRADEIESTTVRLLNVSATAELLARATLREFYGIAARGWSRESTADAEVVILEGADALAEPEAGFNEDLVRAWFVLTGRAVVAHVLLVPVNATAEQRQAVVESLTALLETSNQRRRDLRAIVANEGGLPRERVTAMLTAQRYALTSADAQSLLWLIRRGSAGTDFVPLNELPVLGSLSADAGGNSDAQINQMNE